MLLRTELCHGLGRWGAARRVKRKGRRKKGKERKGRKKRNKKKGK